MTKKSIIISQINQLTTILIENGLSVAQNFPSDKGSQIYINGEFDHSISLKNIDYREIYDVINSENNYNLKFIDGALLQLMYSFENDGSLSKHRLSYFPSPHLLAYDDNIEFYKNDEIYADMISKNILPIPIRFDYEVDPKKYVEISHPYSHMTLGQFKNCRIPLSKPLTPFCFISFILRNFYSSFYILFKQHNHKFSCNNYNRCISESEERILHLNIT